MALILRVLLLSSLFWSSAHATQQSTVSEGIAATSGKQVEEEVASVVLLQTDTLMASRLTATSAVGPPGSCYDNAARHYQDLTCELVLQNMVNGTLFVTFTNDWYLPMALSWAANLRRAIGDNKMLIGAATEETYADLTEAGIPAFRMRSTMGADLLGWGDAHFKEMGRDKARLAVQLVEMNGPTVVLTDSDVMWLQNPLPYFDRYWQADLLVSTDNAGTDRLMKVGPHEFHIAPGAEGMEQRTALVNSEPLPSVNIGFMVFRPGSLEVKSLVRTWLDKVQNSDKWDQEVLNNLLKGRDRRKSDLPGLLETNLAADSQSPKVMLHWGILPGAQFSGGEDFWAVRLFEKLQVPVYGVHADFTNWGLYGKRAKLRALGVWEDGPEYFTGKFLTLDLAVPDELLVPYTDIDVRYEAPERHVQLVNHQLRQIAYAAAIAHGLNRTLVLPEIRCICEFFWAPIHTRQCRFPEMSGKVTVPTEFPYVCPPDQIFNMEILDQRFPHRQSGFLVHRHWSHRAASDAVQLKTQMSEKDGERIFKANTPDAYAQAASIEINPAQTMQELREVLEPHKDTTVMVLTAGTAEKIFRGFDDVTEREVFKQRASGTTGQWCCSDANLVQGGVQYKDLGGDHLGWPASVLPQPKKCQSRFLEKHTNSKGSTIPNDSSSWWGAKYPEVAAWQCMLIGDTSHCAQSTKGLCECPTGAPQCTNDMELAFIEDEVVNASRRNIDELLKKQLNSLSREQLAQRFKAWTGVQASLMQDHTSALLSLTGRSVHLSRQTMIRRAPM